MSNAFSNPAPGLFIFLYLLSTDKLNGSIHREELETTDEEIFNASFNVNHISKQLMISETRSVCEYDT